MEVELKPCPFCGGKAELIRWSIWEGSEITDFVQCTECTADGKHFHDEPDKAIAAWNRRTDDEQDA